MKKILFTLLTILILLPFAFAEIESEQNNNKDGNNPFPTDQNGMQNNFQDDQNNGNMMQNNFPHENDNKKNMPFNEADNNFDDSQFNEDQQLSFEDDNEMFAGDMFNKNESDMCNNIDVKINEIYIKIAAKAKKRCEKTATLAEKCTENREEICSKRNMQIQGINPAFNSCPINKEKMIEICIKGSAKDTDQKCEMEWQQDKDKFQDECKSINYECTEESYIQSCSLKYNEQYANSYKEGDQKIDYNEVCKKQWQNVKTHCEDMTASCDKQKYIKRCMKRANPEANSVDEARKINCEKNIKDQYQLLEQNCKMQSIQTKKCTEMMEKKCEMLKKENQKCNNNGDEFKAMIKKKIESQCRLIKLQTGEYNQNEQNNNPFVNKLMQVLEQNKVPKETYAPTINNIIDAADEVKKVETSEQSKQFFYKLRRVFGFLKQEEKQKEAEEYQIINNNSDKLEQQITTLTEIMNTLENKQQKDALNKQIELLKEQQQELKKLAEKKKKFTEEIMK